jgi:hypothetical protein
MLNSEKQINGDRFITTRSSTNSGISTEPIEAAPRQIPNPKFRILLGKTSTV